MKRRNCACTVSRQRTRLQGEPGTRNLQGVVSLEPAVVSMAAGSRATRDYLQGRLGRHLVGVV